MTNFTLMFVLLLAIGLYHHIGYVWVLKLFSRIQKPITDNSISSNEEKPLPRIGVMMCAYNEQHHIVEKLNNLGALLYPSDKYDIHVYLDGCTDNSVALAAAEQRNLKSKGLRCVLHFNSENKGKAHAINTLIEAGQGYDILVFTDVSALISIDALNQLARQFENSNVVVATGRYTLDDLAPDNQKAYWAYQNELKKLESNVGALIGVPGALFAIRADKVKPLQKGAINDDFILSMQASASGGQAVLDENVIIYERECDAVNEDIKRRERIGAGNWQQLIMLLALLNPRLGWTSFNFISHKALRAVMPIIVALLYMIAFTEMVTNKSMWSISVCTLLCVVHCVGFISTTSTNIVSKVHYALLCYWVALRGIAKYLVGRYNKPWQRVRVTRHKDNGVQLIKRAIDIVGSSLGLVMLTPLMLLAALAIKLDSKGPILYKQQRVGKSTEQFVSLFYVYKFRSMVVDAEAQSGAVWASKNDTRITRVGRFLRKTRIDELPQLWNVLIGEMSLIGPRPERPVFYAKLDKSIPYFGWRTYGLKPGISGLAQVMNGYDESIEDVKSKIGWDYAYALSMSNRKNWLQMEWMILLRTIAVVFTGKGQ